MTARMMSFAVTPGRQLALDGDRHRLERACSGSVWVASTCSTSLVPMPKASAPNAPCVEVCESPQTIVMPGWVSPSCGPTTCTMPCSASPIGCSADAELRAVARAASRPGCARPGRRSAGRCRAVGTLWSSVAMREVGPAHRPPGQPEAVERLRAGDLVHEVQVDVEQVGLARLARVHDVRVPHLLGQVRLSPLLDLPRPICRTRCIGATSTPTICDRGVLRSWTSHIEKLVSLMRQHSGIGVLDKAVAVLARRRPSARAGWPSCAPRTGLPRATAHRLAVGLEVHGLLARDARRPLAPGARAGRAGRRRHRPAASRPRPHVLPRLRDITGESVQLYRRDGLPAGVRRRRPSRQRAARHRAGRLPAADDRRLRGQGACRVGRPADPARGAGRGAVHRARAGRGAPPRLGAERRPSASRAWRSVSAPVRDPSGHVVAAVSVSGPVERIGRRPGARWAGDLLDAADALTARL